ncbi:hypothetical protein T459_27783 [Capsicum annuum]|uniref:UBN2 domain-containing protein n=1 Tax=Capsicum annuum TaxID=4072 RepID=A0A2G2YEY0_CAPAN|nr:hypothetical protein T459_27783 [Capsicum annuum]
MQLHNLKQDDLSVAQFLQKAKLLSDELAAAGRPLYTSNFNICVFKGLRSDFKDIVTTLSARPEPVSYSKLLSLLLNHEFINGSSMTSLSLDSGDSSNPPTANISKHAFNNGDMQNTRQSTNYSATHHIALNLSYLTHVEEYKGPDQLHDSNGQGSGLQDSAFFDRSYDGLYSMSIKPQSCGSPSALSVTKASSTY